MIVIILIVVLLDILGELIFKLIFGESSIGNHVNKFRAVASVVLTILFVGSILREIVKKDK